KRCAVKVEVPNSTAELLDLAIRPVLQLGANQGPLSEKRVHQYRIAGKRARYLAEIAGDDPRAKQLIEQLKRMQDVIGDWHDWLKLTERAEGVFDGAQGAVLIAALRNITRAKYRQAADVLQETRAKLAEKPSASPEISPGKPRHIKVQESRQWRRNAPSSRNSSLPKQQSGNDSVQRNSRLLLLPR